jgi:hypothetical protein
MKSQRSLHILKTIAYILAGLVLALGLIVGISLLATSANVQNMLMPLQLLGGNAISNLIAPFLRSLVSGLGVFSLIVSLVLSLLLYTAGRLLGTIVSLEERLARLEAHAEPARKNEL